MKLLKDMQRIAPVLVIEGKSHRFLMQVYDVETKTQKFIGDPGNPSGINWLKLYPECGYVFTDPDLA